MMIEYLEGIDRSIVEIINGANSPFWDAVMWIVSGKLTWIPFYIFLLLLSIKKFGSKNTILFVIGVLVVVGMADLISNHMFKHVFERYRPSHHALLTNKLHFHQFDNGEFYKGGMYGFVSSHAANFAAICTFSHFYFKEKLNKMGTLFLVVFLLVAYSRIYLGVHYLSDVFCGGILGGLIGWLVYQFIFKYIRVRLVQQ